jgi:hypothetical protein
LRAAHTYEEVTMFRRIATATAAAGALVAGLVLAPAATAGNVAWSVAIGGPGFGVSVGAPGYWGGYGHGYHGGYYRPWVRAAIPAPYYAPYYAPAPVAYAYAVPVPYAAPVYYPRRVVVPAPVVARPIVVPYGRY